MPTPSLEKMVQRQVAKVLERGQRFGKFDQIRQRHFWSSYLFAGYAGSSIPAGAYELFKIPQGQSGQGYPVPLTFRESNWLGAGRIPDNQNFVITEMGVTVLRVPAARQGGTPGGAVDANAPRNGITANLSAAQIAASNFMVPLLPTDVQNILYGMVLEMGFLTNAVPIGYCADFSQSGGLYSFQPSYYIPSDTERVVSGRQKAGDPTNGIPAAAYRRRLEVPILLQHGESQFMRLNVPRAIPIQSLAEGSTGTFEIRVDWWATESFVEKS